MFKHEMYSENAYCNVGDSLQGVAMDYIYSQIPIDEKNVRYIARDGDYNDEPHLGETIIAAYGGLFQTVKENRIPLPAEFTPVFISTLIFQDFFNQYPELLKYIKQYEPVGCRDEQTKSILLRHGIKAYLMGCFTVCLPKRIHKPTDGKVFFVDTPEELNPLIPDGIRQKAIYISHAIPFAVYPVTVEEDIRQKEIAQEYLDRYRDEAEMVVTSRLHAAIPCMAMGIPVILIRDNFDFRFDWVDKFLPLYYLDEAEKINWNPLVIDLEETKEHIISYIKKSCLQLPGAERHLVELDNFYSSRDKVMPNKMIHKKIDNLFSSLKKTDIAYGIWGAGAHCRFVQNIIQEKYPNAKLKVIVDKYVKGSLFGVSIVTGNMLPEYSIDHMFITTLPGKSEAITKMKEIYGSDAEKHYTVITSRVIC